jgi:hypothetical protein
MELDAGADALGPRHLVGVDDGVGEAADPRDDRHAAVAQGVELGQAAGLEPRREQQRVCPGLDEMAEFLVIADDAADPAGIGRNGIPHRPLHGAIALADDRHLRARAQDERQGVEQHVDALLPGQPADDAEQQHIRILPHPHPALQAQLVDAARLDVEAVELGGYQIVLGRIPDALVDAVEDALQIADAVAQQAAEAHAALQRANLLGVFGGDGGDPVGELKARL